MSLFVQYLVNGIFQAVLGVELYLAAQGVACFCQFASSHAHDAFYLLPVHLQSHEHGYEFLAPCDSGRYGA